MIASSAPTTALLEALLDPGRAVDQHVVEALAQAVDQRLHRGGVDVVLLARLRGGEQFERRHALVADQRVVELGASPSSTSSTW